MDITFVQFVEVDSLKAWRFSEFGGLDKLSLEDTTLREPGTGEVKISVAFSAINHVDKLVIGGRLKWVPLPRIPGAEYVGTVTQAGDGVDNRTVGERVAVFPKMFCGRCRYCTSGQESVCLESWNPERAPVDLSTNMLPSSMDGGWAQEALIPARNLVPLPDNIRFSDAACLPLSAMTANHMVSRVAPRSGDTALVMGSTGGVGIFVVQLLKLAGCRVIAVVNNSSQEDGMVRLGADHVIPRMEADVRKEALRLTGGYGADIVVDSLGQSTFPSSLGSLAPCGKYVTAGTMTGPTAELNLMQVYSRQLQIVGSTTGSKGDLQSVVDLASSGKIRPVVDRIYEFDKLKEAAEGHSRQGRTGKVLVRIGGD